MKVKGKAKLAHIGLKKKKRNELLNSMEDGKELRIKEYKSSFKRGM